MEARLGSLLQAVAHDAVQRLGNAAVGLGEVGRIPVQDRADRVGGGVGLEGPTPGQHLVQDRPEGKDVGARVGTLAADLLGGHVTERAQHDAGLGGRGQIRLARTDTLRLRQLREAEVQDLHPPVRCHEDVFGLQVPVRDPLLVRGGEPVGDLQRVPNCAPGGERAAGELRAQRFSLEQFRDDVRRAVLGSNVEDRQDVGMVERARGLRLRFEASQTLRVRGHRRGQHLDGHVALEPRVPRPVDLPHPSRAQRREDLVGAEPSSRRESQREKPTTGCDTLRPPHPPSGCGRRNR